MLFISFLSILQTRENGLYSHWHKEIIRLAGHNRQNVLEERKFSVFNRYKYEILTLDKEVGAFYLYLYGNLLSFIIIILEYLMKIINYYNLLNIKFSLL